jgi:hypothetical protein
MLEFVNDEKYRRHVLEARKVKEVCVGIEDLKEVFQHLGQVTAIENEALQMQLSEEIRCVARLGKKKTGATMMILCASNNKSTQTVIEKNGTFQTKRIFDAIRRIYKSAEACRQSKIASLVNMKAAERKLWKNIDKEVFRSKVIARVENPRTASARIIGSPEAVNAALQAIAAYDITVSTAASRRSSSKDPEIPPSFPDLALAKDSTVLSAKNPSGMSLSTSRIRLNNVARKASSLPRYHPMNERKQEASPRDRLVPRHLLASSVDLQDSK